MAKTRELATSLISEAVSRLVQEANFALPDDVIDALTRALEREESPRGREVLQMMLDNNGVAANDSIPLCQDTGLAVVFVEIGQALILSGQDLNDAIDAGVRTGYRTGYLRKSVAADPTGDRVNTGDNTPAVIHTEVVPGDKLKITVFIKGGGSESVGAAKVLQPAAGVSGIKQFVLDAVRAAGPNPCPPLVIGVGIGGTLDAAGLLAKRALLQPLNVTNPNAKLDRLEQQLKSEINESGVGPAGWGGRVTCLGVRVLERPSHIATLPIAVDISCYCLRRKSVTI